MNPYEIKNHLAYGSDPTLSSTVSSPATATTTTTRPSQSPPIISSNQDPTSSSSSLENTNRLLSDLERKLSIISSTSSNQTQQSQASSVIVNKSLSGIGKQNIQSAVLQYIKNTDNDTNNHNNSSSDNFFNPNELYQERQVKLVTKFGNYYNDDKQQRKINQTNTSNRGKLDDFNDIESQASTIDQEKELNLHGNNNNNNNNNSIHTNSTTSPNTESDNDHNDEVILSTPNLHTVDTSIEGVNVDDPIGIDTEESIEINHPKTLTAENENLNDIIDEPVQQKQYGIFFRDEVDDHRHDIHVDEDDEDEEYEELLLPPSPPRSPPRDMDPSKLYGLYDFSGPDPSHLTLSRDEPVYLINDTDNYWWLVRKMNTEERIKYERLKNLTDDEDEDYNKENEDGKIGFVPAECLETYGERLARLNCFKNEELEKSSKDNLSDLTVNNLTNNDSTSSYGLGIINESGFFQSDDSLSRNNNSSSGILSRGNSLLKRSGSKKSNKSVTFENLADLALDEEDDDDGEDDNDKSKDSNEIEGDILTNNDEDLIREEKKKAGFDIDNYYDIPHSEINKNLNDDLLAPHINDDEKRSEVLSDVYPTETPLIINKNSKKTSPTIISSLTSTTEKTINQSQQTQPLLNLMQPPSKTNNQAINPYDTISIGSFSPDTPPIGFLRSNDSPSHQLTTPVDDKFDAIGMESISAGRGGHAIDEGYVSPNLNLLRRSVILDRLTKVTSDIQDSLDEFDIDDLEDEQSPIKEISTKELLPPTPPVPTPQANDSLVNKVIASRISSTSSTVSAAEHTEESIEHDKEVKVYHSTPEPETSFHTPQEVEATLSEHNISNNYPTILVSTDKEIVPEAGEIIDRQRDEDEDDEFEEDETNDQDDVGQREHEDITPLTSMNSLNYGISNILSNTPNKLSSTLTPTNTTTTNNTSSETPVSTDQITSPITRNIPSLTTTTKTNVADKRKSRPVHDMFMPILGKFDELAEKLAELEDLL